MTMHRANWKTTLNCLFVCLMAVCLCHAFPANSWYLGFVHPFFFVLYFIFILYEETTSRALKQVRVIIMPVHSGGGKGMGGGGAIMICESVGSDAASWETETNKNRRKPVQSGQVSGPSLRVCPQVCVDFEYIFFKCVCVSAPAEKSSSYYMNLTLYKIG